jgi:hypothetical protein
LAEHRGIPCNRCGSDQWRRDAQRGWRCSECSRQWQQDSYRRTVGRQMWRQARKRALRDGVEFTIVPEQVLVPSHCPALGIPLMVSHRGKGGRDNSPSLDRIDPTQGYVPGNVAVISSRANRAKNDLTCEELAAVLAYARCHTRTTE